jgi:hypothetical protein
MQERSMTSHEESSFLEAVESRLDSIFGSDSKPARQTDSTGADIADEIAAGIRNGLQENPILQETGQSPSDPATVRDQSAYLSEIDKRFTAIFGDIDTQNRAAENGAEPDDLKGLVVRVGREEPPREENFSEDLTLFSSSPSDFPLKNLQSIVFSMEAQMSDSALERLDNEVLRLDRLYKDDPIIQGLLRILRFAERYIRIRDARSSRDAMDLLFSVYSRLELVTGGEEMTQETRRHFLKESIDQYRSWVQSADLEKRVDPDAPAGIMDEGRAREMEATDDRLRKDAGMEDVPFARIRVVEEQKPSGAGGKDAERLAAAIKDLPPNEAFAWELAELKKTFQDEITVLKEEIRLLKAKGNKSL